MDSFDSHGSRSHRAIDVHELLGKLETSAAPAFSWKQSFPEIVGRSKAMRQVLEDVARVAPAECPVLIYGESGTGKELIASALHRLSRRSSKRFVAINCSAIPETLLETELFGHERGAFTGAMNKRSGLLEAANGGTLFLDEIGDMPLSLQSKLLRVLQEKQYTPVGGVEIKQADVRIIAATHVNLEQAVKAQRFRLDLFYRLNVVPVLLPALRHRRDDVAALLEHFLEVFNRQYRNHAPKAMSDMLVDKLSYHSWPGNIRELQNLVERLVVTSPEAIISEGDLPQGFFDQDSCDEEEASFQPREVRTQETFTTKNHRFGGSTLTLGGEGRARITVPSEHVALPEQGISLPDYIETLENSLILQALERTSNNKNQAAKLLGINRTTLVERLKKRNIGMSPKG